MTLLKKRLLWCIPVMLVANAARAQLRFASLQDIWAYAEQHNIQLKSAHLNGLIAGINIKQAYGAMLPVVTATGGYTDNIKIQPTLIPEKLLRPNVPDGVFTEATFGRRFIYNGGIFAQFDILNIQDWYAIRRARLNDAISRFNIANVKMGLYQQLADTYYACMLLTEAERLSRENLKTTTAIYELADNKFHEGVISEATINTVLINREKAGKSLDAATQHRQLQLNNLQLLLNVSDSIVLTGNPDEGTLTDAEDSFPTDPAIKLSDARMQLSENELRNARAALAPTLSAIYQYNLQLSTSEFLKSKDGNTMPQQYWGLRLTAPLFAGKTRLYNIQKAKIDYDIQQKEHHHTRLQSDINNKNLLLAYKASLKTYEKAKNILALYQSNDAHATRKFNEGIISLDERLKSYSDLIINQNEYLQNMSDYFIQQYLLKIRQTNFVE
ncbi:TolC family protein [Chitinophaga varians]|uniref:TolC family protein n=1 Tax=Chitinophaga varians TaxID=2202339 RepID=A0A847RUJ8_9BACT|nr:TolC family protein [Chitinophaga varians]NLR65554.1 TolC family protein [Chitinophaga varians]